MAKVADGFEEPDPNKPSPDQEHTGKVLLQSTRDFSWAVYSGPGLDALCLGAKDFKRAEVIEANYYMYDTNKEVVSIEFEIDIYCCDIPKKYLLLSNEFLDD
tara:strand:+ start:3817 stop:4122 length:306 start_codon:yes stop_codon:yes gene_type:complete